MVLVIITKAGKEQTRHHLELCEIDLVVFQPCGVDYELKTYVAETPDEKPHKRLVVC